MFGETTAIALTIGLDNHSIAICTRSVFPLVNISQLEERKETLILKTLIENQLPFDNSVLLLVLVVVGGLYVFVPGFRKLVNSSNTVLKLISS